MKIRTLSTLLTSMTFLLSCSSHENHDYIDKSHLSVLSAWFAKNPEFSIANESDCGCDDKIKEIRKGQGGAWKPQPNYHPYYAAGDFNSDKVNDFAIVLNSKQSGKLYVAIFNGPFTSGSQPAYLGPTYGALFYGPPRPEPYRLLAGEFNSEGAIFEPTDTTYKPSSAYEDQ